MQSKDHKPIRIISVGSSSKKAGKSALASSLVEELGARFGLKVSSGSHRAGDQLVSSQEVLSEPGTDTGKLIAAGARQVLWVSCDPSQMRKNIRRALSMFRGEGLLVAEGNGAVRHLDSDLTVFLMGVPFEQFKPSALPALQRADLVLVDTSAVTFSGELEKKILEYAPSAKIVYYDGDSGSETGWDEALTFTKNQLGL